MHQNLSKHPGKIRSSFLAEIDLRKETGPVTIRVRVFYSDGGRWKNGWMLEGLVLEPILKA